MKQPGADIQENQFVETPAGIFTASGIWFHTTEGLLRAYAGPVLEREPIGVLIGQAEAWLRGGQTLALWLTPALLLVLPPAPTVLLVLALYLGWQCLGPSLASRAVSGLLRVLEKVSLQGLYYVLVLSILAAQDQFAALWTGVAVFILLRWGLLERAAAPLVQRVRGALYDLPASDLVLRGFILRAALRYGVALPEIDRIEQQIRRNLSRGGR